MVLATWKEDIKCRKGVRGIAVGGRRNRERPKMRIIDTRVRHVNLYVSLAQYRDARKRLTIRMSILYTWVEKDILKEDSDFRPTKKIHNVKKEIKKGLKNCTVLGLKNIKAAVINLF